VFRAFAEKSGAHRCTIGQDLNARHAEQDQGRLSRDVHGAARKKRFGLLPSHAEPARRLEVSEPRSARHFTKKVLQERGFGISGRATFATIMIDRNRQRDDQRGVLFRAGVEKIAERVKDQKSCGKRA